MYVFLVESSRSTTSRYRSRSWLTVAFVRGSGARQAGSAAACAPSQPGLRLAGPPGRPRQGRDACLSPGRCRLDPHPVGAARQPVDGAALASVVEPESLDAARGSGQDRSRGARPSRKDGDLMAGEALAALITAGSALALAVFGLFTARMQDRRLL